MSHTTIETAVVYQPMSDSDKSTQTQEDRLYMPALRSFKNCSLVLGLLVGFFIYLSTLGAEFVGVMLWGREILNKSNRELIAFSLLWNFITTMVAIVILSSMRQLVSIVFVSLAGARHNIEDVLCELLSYMEGRFAVGALVGICLSWNVTNVVLGMKPQIIQSVIILAVACLWCRVTLVLLGSPDPSLIHDQAETEEEEQEKEALLNV